MVFGLSCDISTFFQLKMERDVMSRRTYFLAVFSIIWLIVSAAPSWADDTPTGFLPVWRLLSSEQKQQFIAGYLQGLRDAGRITDVLATYIKDNPNKATETLAGSKEIYDFSGLNTASLVREIDRYFHDPNHSQATLSLAATAARNTLRTEPILE